MKYVELLQLLSHALSGGGGGGAQKKKKNPLI